MHHNNDNFLYSITKSLKLYSPVVGTSKTRITYPFCWSQAWLKFINREPWHRNLPSVTSYISFLQLHTFVTFSTLKSGLNTGRYLTNLIQQHLLLNCAQDVDDYKRQDSSSSSSCWYPSDEQRETCLRSLSTDVFDIQGSNSWRCLMVVLCHSKTRRPQIVRRARWHSWLLAKTLSRLFASEHPASMPRPMAWAPKAAVHAGMHRRRETIRDHPRQAAPTSPRLLFQNPG